MENNGKSYPSTFSNLKRLFSLSLQGTKNKIFYSWNDI